MDFVRKWWTQILAFLAGMSFAHRALMIMTVVVLAVVLGLAAYLTGRPQMSPIVQLPADKQAMVKARLEAAGIAVEVRGSQLYVPVDKQIDAHAILAENDLLANDTSSAWDQMIAKSTPFDTNMKSAQVFLLTKQKVLGQIISKMAGVRSADVMLSMPEHQGFGATVTRPSASVTVIMQGNRRVENRLVEAIAGLVSGAVSGMKAQDVVTIDANIGRQFTVKSPDDLGAGDTNEVVQALEQYTRNKIAETLSYIPGVIVAVNVRTESVLSRTREEIGYDKSQPVASESTKEREMRDGETPGEPGVRSNVGVAIEGGGGSRRYEKTTESKTEFRDKNITSKTSTREAGHAVKRINATINVPRGYFVRIFKQGKPGDAPEPDDAALAPVVEAQLAQIQEQVKPLIQTDAEGAIAAHMIPDSSIASAVGAAPATAGGKIGAALTEPETAKTAVLAGLAALAVGLMLYVTRKATAAPRM
ncbi:MAG: hypothetical protein NTW19_19295, partial [Planctomycetota bacterium]|nr:hypothetical protein [Planctomycetota bacterium]